MAELNKIRFFLLVSLMIYSSHAMELLFSNANGTFRHYTSILFDSMGQYVGTSRRSTFKVQNGTVKAVVHVCNSNTFDKIMRRKNENDRTALAAALGQRNYELFFLGLKNHSRFFIQFIVGEFIRETIKTESEHGLLIEILGEIGYHIKYMTTINTYDTYNEDDEGILRDCFNAMAARE